MIDLRLGDCLETLRAMPDASVDSVVTDPPYGLGKEPKARDVLRAWLDGEEFKPGGAGFMGKSWDAFVPSPLVWAECLRVLKPGGHLVAFAGSRTYDWIVMGVRLAGFEVRDQLFWMYGSGFPKNLDVSKAIDRKRYDRADVYRVTAWIRETRDAAGVTNRQIDDAFGFAGMAGHWTSAKSQPAVPTIDQIPQLLNVLGVTLDDVPEEIRSLIWTLNGRKGQPGAAWFDREIVGTAKSSLGGTVAAGERDPDFIEKHRSHEFNITAPATEAARQWDGWGTALKPSHEPIVLARKPLSGTVADNVQEHGTGAINVDGCRVGGGPSPSVERRKNAAPRESRGATGWNTPARPPSYNEQRSGEQLCRWPANILHDGSPEVLAVFPDQSDRFYYCAKASRAERELGLADFTPETVGDGRRKSIDNAYQRGKTERRNVHPTVKPAAVMRWLVRCVTPPNGTVLDPYTGSGTTGVAAALEGFGFIGCELSPEYVEIARARISHAREFPAMWEPDYQPPDEVPEEQLDLFAEKDSNPAK
jgi:DNA modification methylase